MPRQTDHGTCLELMQNRPLTRVIYLTHNRALQKLAATISTAKEETTPPPKTNALIFTTEGGTKSWHVRLVMTTNQRKCLLDGCDDWDVSADPP